MQLSYKHRLYPTRAQVDVLGGMMRDFRALYNAALQQRIEARNRRHNSLGYTPRAKRATGVEVRLAMVLTFHRATNQRPVYEP